MLDLKHDICLIRERSDCMPHYAIYLSFFLFNDRSTSEIYTLSLHDALPIRLSSFSMSRRGISIRLQRSGFGRVRSDRKSTRLNSSHTVISYAVFCLKKKTTKSGPDHHMPHRMLGRARTPVPVLH